MNQGYFDRASVDHEVLQGWILKTDAERSTVWLHSSISLTPIPLECTRESAIQTLTDAPNRFTFQVAIDELPSEWHQPGLRLYFCFDHEGTEALPGSEAGFKIPSVLHGPKDFYPKAHDDGTDRLPVQAQAACNALRRYGGFFSHWYWEQRHPRKSGTIPAGFTSELLALCTGSIVNSPLNPFESYCPREWLQNLWHNPTLLSESLTEPSNREAAINSWHKKLWKSDKPLQPHHLMPWFRQHLIIEVYNQAPTVSVIIANWNRRSTILRAIDSALQQTYSPSEILVVDDGSVDGSLAAIIRRFPSAIAQGQLKLLSGAHQGVSRARNRAMETAHGDWFAYLDSDNAWHPDHLLIMLYTALKSEKKPSITYTGRRLFGPRVSGRILPTEPFDRKRLCVGNFVDLNCLLHHRFLYDQHGGFDKELKRLVDWDLTLRFTEPSLGTSVQHVNMITVDYWLSGRHLNNISCQGDLAAAIEAVLSKHKNQW